ncbi:hypothetical protein [Streptomyces sp. NPDC006463]|uniref:hypothetical protein n=1 Tax=Streptomyces sp. NPDC006463 TaxID=3364746 RepID=UPI0036C6CC93
MNGLHIGPASEAYLSAARDLFKTAAEGTSIGEDPAGVERLHASGRWALLLARREDAPVPDRNERVHLMGDAAGHEPREQSKRRVKPLGGPTR